MNAFLPHTKPEAWTKDQDELLGHLVDLNTPLEIITIRLNRSATEIRRRGDLIGLPLKWFQRVSLRQLREYQSRSARSRDCDNAPPSLGNAASK
jgi:hypothetical protein